MKKISLSLLSLFFCLFITLIAHSASVPVYWDNNPDAFGYKIYQRTPDIDYNFDNPIWTGTGTEALMVDLAEDGLYFFVIKAYNSCGNYSGPSIELQIDVAEAICLQTPVPSTPSGCYIGTVTK